MVDLLEVAEARIPRLQELVDDCARGKLPFDELCLAVANMGFRTTSLHEHVRAAEQRLRR